MAISEGPDGRPVAFHDLPVEKFPIVMTAYAPDGSVVWEKTIEPYVMVEIPGTGPGSVKRVKMLYADGSVEEHIEE